MNKYKNAGISSFGEAEARLRKGENFYFGGRTIYYAPSVLPNKSPYRIGGASLYDSWPEFKHWDIRVEWYEDIAKQVPCLVWNNKRQEKHLMYVLSHDPDSDYPFYTPEGSWKFAEPLAMEECLSSSSNSGNANIDSEEEALSRLSKGEEFMYSDSHIKFDESYIAKGESPFRYIYINDFGEVSFNVSLKLVLKLFKDWRHNTTKWYENLSRPIPCHVWDSDQNKDLNIIRYIHKYDNTQSYLGWGIYPFIDSSNNNWRYAEPIKPEECLGYQVPLTD